MIRQVSHKRFIALGVAGVIVLYMATFAFDYFSGRQVCRTQARVWLARAKGQTSPQTTAEDATRWLKENGFVLEGLNGNAVGERTTGATTVDQVRGYMLVVPRSIGRSPRWVEVDFSFKTTGERWQAGAFLGVEVLSDVRPPWWVTKEAAATQPAAR